MRFTYFLLAIILFIYGIIAAREFLYPIAFGVLLAYLLFPVANFLEMKGLPRILSIIISILFALIVIAGGGLFIYDQFTTLFSDFPELKRQAISNIDTYQHSLENVFGFQDDFLDQYVKQWVTGFFENIPQNFNAIFSATTGTLLRIFLMPVYIFLFLYYRTKFAYFILKVVPDDKERVTIKILRDISTVVTRYMGGVVIVVSILCLLNSFGLYLVGMKYPIIFGVISALINFIPYFGTLMGGAIPLLFAILIGETPLLAVRVLILFIIIQFIENNILTPNIVGSSLKINPFFIIFSLIVGAMIWGIPGMLVVVPFLAMLKRIFKNFDSLQPYAFLLGTRGTQKHSISGRNLKSYFNRMKNKLRN